MPPRTISKAWEARKARAKVPVKRPSLDFVAGEVVNLYVGEAAKLHGIHKDLLLNTSLYFRKAFTGRFKEKDGEIVLDDIPERAFGVLKIWLYAQKLERPKTLRDKYKVRVRFVKEIDADGNPIYGRVPLEEFDEMTMTMRSDLHIRIPHEQIRIIYLRGRYEAFDYQTPKFWHWDDLVDVYIMADKYDFPHLRDDIIKQWQYQATNFGSICTIETVARAFENLPDKSHLLSLIVEHWAFFWKPQPTSRDTKAMYSTAPRQFLARLVVAQAAYKGKKNTDFRPEFRRMPCCQHEHLGEDDSCNGYEDWSFGTSLSHRIWYHRIVPAEESEGSEDDEDAAEDDDGALVIE